MKKRWWISVILVSVVTVSIVLGIFLLSQKESKENQVNDVVKINESLYYKSLDDKLIIYDEENGQRVSNELIIYTDDMDKEIIETCVAEEKGKIVGYIELTNTYQVEFDTQVTADELRAKKSNLEKNNHIEWVAYNHVFHTASYSAFYPNDKRWKNRWKNMEYGNWGLKAIHCPEAWDYIQTHEKDLSEIQMGIFEVDLLNSEHEDLKENIGNIFGYIDKKKLKKTELNHGTEVTGIIGAAHNNKKGISGVMMNNVKMNYYSYNGKAGYRKTSEMNYICGLTSLIELGGQKHTTIINLSLGVDQYLVGTTWKLDNVIQEVDNINRTFEKHLKSMISKGYDFLLVKAAGNLTNMPLFRVDFDKKDENTHGYYIPYIKEDDSKKKAEYDKYSYLYKRYEKDFAQRIYQGDIDTSKDIFSGITDEEIKERILVVGGIDKPKDQEYPLYFYSCKGNRIDIAAPATCIESTSAVQRYQKDLYGTSYAAPYVSGVAGLMLTVNPELSGNELKTILQESGSGKYNFGMNGETHEVPCVDAYKAVKMADNYDENKGENFGDQLFGSWVQVDSDDPVLLTLNEDLTMQYYNTVSHESDYNSTFEWEDRLYFNLLNLTDSNVTTVPYKVEMHDEQKLLQMTLTLDNAQTLPDMTPLCGMEKIMAGTYEKLSFSKAQLETIKTDLGVPKDMDVVIVQSPPYYWEPGQSWLTHVIIYDKSNQHLAEATFYSKTAELCRGMIKYAG